MYYLQKQINRRVKTIDMFADELTAQAMLAQIRLSDPYNYYYLSNRQSKNKPYQAIA
jgi:6-phosphogluconolactonase (cycloisomerase 2 family)